MAKMVFITFYDTECLGIRYMSSNARKHGHEINLIFVKEITMSEIKADSDLEGSSNAYMDNSLFNGTTVGTGYYVDPWSDYELQLLAEQIAKINPDIIGLSTRSFFTKVGEPVMQLLKERFSDIPFICGGYGPSLDPEWFLNWADYVAFGEYDSSILTLLDAVDGKSSITGCPGVIFRNRNGGIVRNPISTIEAELDTFPFADWEDDNKYLIQYNRVVPGSRFQNRENHVIMAGRGCLGNCSYCQAWAWRDTYKRIYGLRMEKYRQRNPGNVLQELKGAKIKGARFISFIDPVLCSSRKWLEDLHEGYVSEINLPFQANSEPRFTNDWSLERLADMGMKFTDIGIQSGSHRVRSQVFNRPVKDQAILDRCHRLDSYGIHYYALIIGWNPYETIDDYEIGLNLFLKLRTGIDLKLFRLKVFPGSRLMAMSNTLKTSGLSEDVHTYYAHLFSYIFNNDESRKFALSIHKRAESIERKLAELLVRKKDILVPIKISRIVAETVFPSDSLRNRLNFSGFSTRKAKEIIMDYDKEYILDILNSAYNKFGVVDITNEACLKFLENKFKPTPGRMSPVTI